MKGDVAATSHLRPGCAYIGGMAKDCHGISEGRRPGAARARIGPRARRLDWAPNRCLTERAGMGPAGVPCSSLESWPAPACERVRLAVRTGKRLKKTQKHKNTKKHKNKQKKKIMNRRHEVREFSPEITTNGRDDNFCL